VGCFSVRVIVQQRCKTKAISDRAQNKTTKPKEAPNEYEQQNSDLQTHTCIRGAGKEHLLTCAIYVILGDVVTLILTCAAVVRFSTPIYL
jgi:hypothetical protein